eukprot:2389046-Prymnesium_polylepis.1
MWARQRQRGRGRGKMRDSAPLGGSALPARRAALLTAPSPPVRARAALVCWFPSRALPTHSPLARPQRAPARSAALRSRPAARGASRAARRRGHARAVRR